jgi:hypothetical protein
MDWRQDPLNSVEPTKVARRVMQEKFRDSGVYRWRNDWWVWKDHRWAVLDDERLKDLIWVCLEDAVWEKPTRNGVALERYSPDKQKIDGVARALEALVRIDAEVVPCWIGKPLGDFSPHTTIAFADMLFNAETGKTMQRPKNWFDPAVLPVNFSEEFACPRWEQAVKEWGDGDPVWAELLSRWMGYCLLGTRRYARWMLMYGKIRGGKGTITTIMRKLIGRAAFMSSSLEDLSGEFGMDGLERSKVLAINEVNEVDSKAGERVCRVLKNIVGQDPLTVNVKHQRQQRNVIVNAAPMLQSNEIPVLPNKGRGLSGKMLVLAVIYGTMNILSFVALQYIGAGEFTICAQLKILTTAGFSVLILRTSMSWTRWRALVLLVLGCTLVASPTFAGDKAGKSKEVTSI